MCKCVYRRSQQFSEWRNCFTFVGPISVICSSVSLTKSDRHIGGAGSQAHCFVLVLPSNGQFHAEPVTFAVEGFRLKSQLVATMELLQNFFQSLGIGLGSYSQVLSAGLGRNIVSNGCLFTYQPYSRRPAIPQAIGDSRGLQQLVYEAIGLRSVHSAVVAIKEDHHRQWFGHYGVSSINDQLQRLLQRQLAFSIVVIGVWHGHEYLL